MDLLDLKILRCLQGSARISHSEIGKRIGLSLPAVSERIKKLERTGRITGYAVLLGAARLGRGITAFIEVAISDPKSYAAFGRSVVEMEDVLECHHIVGAFDYLMKVRVRDTAHLERIISDSIRAIPGVGRTQTTVVLSTMKEDAPLPLDMEVFEQ